MRFLRSAQRAQGTLIGYQSKRDSEGDLLHHPIFRFEDGSGKQITASNPRHVWVVRRLAVGQTCRLLYNPANPAQVFRDHWLDVWFLPAALWAVSALALVQRGFIPSRVFHGL